MNKSDHQKSRRDFLKKAAYTAPVILTMKAVPAFARNGSPVAYQHGNNGIGQEKRGIVDGPPPGLAGRPYQDFNDHGNFAARGRGRPR